jgi:hypothetical protein
MTEYEIAQCLVGSEICIRVSCLVGSVEHVRDRLDAWRSAGVTTLLAKAREVRTVRALAEAAA